VIAAPDAQAAVALLEAERPEVALCDLLMPGMSGLEFCRWARGRPELDGLKFVLLTGMDTEDTRREAADAGADAVVTKPFDRLGLLAKIEVLRSS
jgi:CheY-like chemotaxis protein